MEAGRRGGCLFLLERRARFGGAGVLDESSGGGVLMISRERVSLVKMGV